MGPCILINLFFQFLKVIAQLQGKMKLDDTSLFCEADGTSFKM